MRCVRARWALWCCVIVGASVVLTCVVLAALLAASERRVRSLNADFNSLSGAESVVRRLADVSQRDRAASTAANPLHNVVNVVQQHIQRTSRFFESSSGLDILRPQAGSITFRRAVQDPWRHLRRSSEEISFVAFVEDGEPLIKRAIACSGTNCTYLQSTSSASMMCVHNENDAPAAGCAHRDPVWHGDASGSARWAELSALLGFNFSKSSELLSPSKPFVWLSAADTHAGVGAAMSTLMAADGERVGNNDAAPAAVAVVAARVTSHIVAIAFVDVALSAAKWSSSDSVIQFLVGFRSYHDGGSRLRCVVCSTTCSTACDVSHLVDSEGGSIEVEQVVPLDFVDGGSLYSGMLVIPGNATQLDPSSVVPTILPPPVVVGFRLHLDASPAALQSVSSNEALLRGRWDLLLAPGAIHAIVAAVSGTVALLLAASAGSAVQWKLAQIEKLLDSDTSSDDSDDDDDANGSESCMDRCLFWLATRELDSAHRLVLELVAKAADVQPFIPEVCSPIVVRRDSAKPAHRKVSLPAAAAGLQASLLAMSIDPSRPSIDPSRPSLDPSSRPSTLPSRPSTLSRVTITSQGVGGPQVSQGGAVLLVNVHDFNGIVGRLGPNALSRAYGELYETIADTCKSRGGHIAVFHGDFFLATFFRSPASLSASTKSKGLPLDLAGSSQSPSADATELPPRAAALSALDLQSVLLSIGRVTSSVAHGVLTECFLGSDTARRSHVIGAPVAQCVALHRAAKPLLASAYASTVVAEDFFSQVEQLCALEIIGKATAAPPPSTSFLVGSLFPLDAPRRESISGAAQTTVRGAGVFERHNEVMRRLCDGNVAAARLLLSDIESDVAALPKSIATALAAATARLSRFCSEEHPKGSAPWLLLLT